jgi:hypothetical protein
MNRNYLPAAVAMDFDLVDGAIRAGPVAGPIE